MANQFWTSSRPDDRWQFRQRRAIELQAVYPKASSILEFYAVLLGFQGKVAKGHQFKADVSEGMLRGKIDIEFAVGQFPELISLVMEHAPAALAAEASDLQTQGENRWRELVKCEIEAQASAQFVPQALFARACLQPMAENLQLAMPPTKDAASRCRACGGGPQLAILRPEGDGAERSLQCSFCLREWVYRRVVCPWCGEENKDKLPNYSADEMASIRVQACDTCTRYLKTVDLSTDGRAVPLVDEVAGAVMDIWATKQGYSKIEPNLMAF